ncbi:hypothetical protein HPG69_016196 [Diceros bicornis minor]|uniref:Uncharacterized protein n=1 Tax=Diceros bicornis minor TaxID=77932 RepID=A0A7J7FHV9_DICBM|nr:hypothetical protein HPG69_016196 [Diceros bicornis minor]
MDPDSAAQPTCLLGAAKLLVTNEPVDLVSTTDQLVKVYLYKLVAINLLVIIVIKNAKSLRWHIITTVVPTGEVEELTKKITFLDHIKAEK